MQKLISLQDKYSNDHTIFDQLLLEYEKMICKDAEMAIKLNLIDKLFLLWKQQLQDKDTFKRVLISAMGSFNLMSLVYLHELPATTSTFHVVQLEHCMCLKRSTKALPNRQLHAILLNKIYSALSDVHRYYNKQLEEDNDTESHYSMTSLQYFYFDGKALNQLGMYYQYESIKKPIDKLQNGIYTFYFYLFANLTPYPFTKSEDNLQHFIKVFLGLIMVDVHPYSKLLYLLFKWYAKQSVDYKDTELLLIDSLTFDLQNVVFKCCIGLYLHLNYDKIVFYGVLKLFLKFNKNTQLTANFINFMTAYIDTIKDLLVMDQGLRLLFDEAIVLLRAQYAKTADGKAIITIYDFDLTHLKVIGQFIGEIAIEFADLKGITDDQDVCQLAMNEASNTLNERIVYCLSIINKEIPALKHISLATKLKDALDYLKSNTQIVVILTEKSITATFIPKVATWVNLNQLVLIIPSFVYKMILKNVINHNQTDAWGVVHGLIVQELKKQQSTLILQDGAQEQTVEACFETFNALGKQEKKVKLFVLGSMKDYLRIPTIDIFTLEQLIQ